MKSSSAGTGSVQQRDMRKLMGEPLPAIVDPDSLPPELAALFAAYGLLERIRKKLALLSRKKGNTIFPAIGTIACVDADDNLYVGVEFLAKFHKDENLVAGILAHEWGHIVSELDPNTDFAHLNWDQLFELRRDEERKADAFAGRTLYRMGYSPESMIQFLVNLEKKVKLKSHKYDTAETRAAIIKEAFISELKNSQLTQKLFGDQNGYKQPNSSILIATA